MNQGKISDSVLRRSVLKYLKENNSTVNSACQIMSEAKAGADYALFAVPEKEVATATAVTVGQGAGAAVEAIINAANNLICGGAEIFGVTISILLPESANESELKEVMEEALRYARMHRITVLGGHTAVSRDVAQTVITVTAIGSGTGFKVKKCKPGMDIVMSKWIGLQGTAKIAAHKKEELLQKLPKRLVQEAISFGCAGTQKDMSAECAKTDIGEVYMSVVPEAQIAMRHGVCLMHDVSGGGIFRALWELSDLTGTGILAEMKKIPIRQETVEICEVFGLNPYELLSGGALLMITEDGEALAEALYAEGIPAKVIGKLTDNHDKALLNRSYESEEIRYLERPKFDEIDKIL